MSLLSARVFDSYHLLSIFLDFHKQTTITTANAIQFTTQHHEQQWPVISIKSVLDFEGERKTSSSRSICVFMVSGQTIT